MTQNFVISMKATLDPSEVRSGARASTAAIQEITSAATAAERQIKARIFQSTDSFGARSARQAATDIDAYGRELDSLRARYNPLFAASKRYETELDGINRAHAVGAINAQEQAAAIARLDAQYTTATQAANINAAASRNSANAMRASSFQTANLAAQFNDIGLMMASGQSPLLLALQQGTQVSQVIGPMGAAGAVKALGSAFLSVISPVSLLTIGVIAAGAAAFQYFSSVLTDGRDSSRVIEEQEDLIRSVAERWGDATPALKAYVDELERAQDAEDRQAAVGSAIDQAFADLRNQLPDLRGELANARVDLQDLGEEASSISALQNAFDDFARGVEDGTATTEELDEVLSILANTTGSTIVPSLVNLQSVLSSVSAALAEASQRAADFRADLPGIGSAIERGLGALADTSEFISEQQRLNSLTAEQLDLEREIERVRSDASQTGAFLSEEAATQIAKDRLAAEERRSELARLNRPSRSDEVSAYERVTKSIEEKIDALHIEQVAMGLGEEAALRFVTAMEMVRAAEEDGVVVTAALLAEINALAGEFAAAEGVAGRFADDAFDLAEELEDAFEGVGSGIVKAMREGGDVAGNVFDMLIDKAWDFAAAWADSVISDGIGALISMVIPSAGGTASIVPNANGNVFGGDTLDAHRNQIVSSPTFFAFAKGAALGVMGEAGEEAIMPLARNSSGQLGVHVANGNQANDNWRTQFNFEQNITPPSGFEMRSREEDTPGGKRQEIWFEEVVAGAISRPGPAQRAVRSTGRLRKR
tara:strand:- start:26954 stop:29257 length:2304 start_codon:yes stop_codon:yes gene_type:complete